MNKGKQKIQGGHPLIYTMQVVVKGSFEPIHFKYLDAIFDFSRRKHSPSPLLGPICMRQTAHIVLHCAQAQPKYWEKPENRQRNYAAISCSIRYLVTDIS